MSLIVPTIVVRQDNFAALEIWLDREREAFPFLKEKKTSPATPIMPGAYNFKEEMIHSVPSQMKMDQQAAMVSPKPSVKQADMTSLNLSKSDQGETKLRLPSTLKSATTPCNLSPQSETTTTVMTTTSTASKRRKSLGSEMGLILFSSINSEESEGRQTEQSFDSFGSPNAQSAREIPLSPEDTVKQRRDKSPFKEMPLSETSEREIIIIEMDEEIPVEVDGAYQDQEEYGKRLPGEFFKLVNKSSLDIAKAKTITQAIEPENLEEERQEPVNEEREEMEWLAECVNEEVNNNSALNQVKFYAVNGVHYLDPVEEVTEEPTMIEWTESEVEEEEEDEMCSSAGTPRLVRTFSPVPNQIIERDNRTKLQEWAQLHGLATPSSFAGSPSRSPSKPSGNKSRFGWAEVISNARYSDTFQKPEGESSTTLNKLDKVLVFANVASSTAKAAISSSCSSSPSVTFSPANVIGLRSAFWMTSPTKVSIDNQLSLAANITQKKRLQLGQKPPPRKSSMYNLLQTGVETMVQKHAPSSNFTFDESPEHHDQSISNNSPSRCSMEPSGLPNESGWLDGATDSPIPVVKQMHKPRWSNVIHERLSTLASSRSTRIPSGSSGSSKKTM